MMFSEDHTYDDILNMPHHVSAKHPRMDGIDRAAQFSPFAALTGFEAAIEETIRLNEERIKKNDEISRQEVWDGRTIIFVGDDME